MNIYLTKGVATPFSASGAGNVAASLVTLTVMTQSITVPLIVEGSSQDTKAGVSRTMLKSRLATPKIRPANSEVGMTSTATGGSEESSFHGVLTLSPSVKLLLQNGTTNTEGLAIVHMLVAAIVAAACGNQSALSTSVAVDSPLMRGANGLYPFDTANGAYGNPTA